MVNWVRTHTHIFKEIKRWIFIKLIFAHFYLHSAFIFTLSPLKRKMLCLIPQSIATKATYTHTHTYMDGISWVLQPRHLHNTHTHTHMHVYIIVLPCTQNQHEICLWPKLKCICNNPCVCVCVNLVLHPAFLPPHNWFADCPSPAALTRYWAYLCSLVCYQDPHPTPPALFRSSTKYKC